MSKTTYILALAILWSTFSFSQQITFHENVNYRANALLQSLNKAGDSLFLESKSEQILKVDIFNDDFSESIDIFSNSAKIDLKSLPIGNFVIQAKVAKQWIIMFLEKKDDFKIASTVPRKKIVEDNIIAFKNKSSTIVKGKNSLYYWVITESNSSFGSIKSMRLEHKDDVDKLILKNKLELKSNIGKANNLIVYEIYNKSEFMDKQLRNPAYYTTAEASKFLNTEPHYASNGE